MLNCEFLLNGTEASIASTSPVRGSIETSAAAGAPCQFIMSVSDRWAAFCSCGSSVVWISSPPFLTVFRPNFSSSVWRTHDTK